LHFQTSFSRLILIALSKSIEIPKAKNQKSKKEHIHGKTYHLYIWYNTAILTFSFCILTSRPPFAFKDGFLQTGLKISKIFPAFGIAIVIGNDCVKKDFVNEN
jgi:hypothetical protein